MSETGKGRCPKPGVSKMHSRLCEIPVVHNAAFMSFSAD